MPRALCRCLARGSSSGSSRSRPTSHSSMASPSRLPNRCSCDSTFPMPTHGRAQSSATVRQTHGGRPSSQDGISSRHAPRRTPSLSSGAPLHFLKLLPGRYTKRYSHRRLGCRRALTLVHRSSPGSVHGRRQPSGVPVAPSSASVMKSACMADRHEVRGQSHDPIFDDVALLDISHCTR